MKQEQKCHYDRRHQVRETSPLPDDMPVWVDTQGRKMPQDRWPNKQMLLDLTGWAHHQEKLGGIEATSEYMQRAQILMESQIKVQLMIQVQPSQPAVLRLDPGLGQLPDNLIGYELGYRTELRKGDVE